MIRVGESAWLLELSRSAEVLAACRAVEQLADPAIADVVPGATTLLVVGDPAALPDPRRLERIERDALAGRALAADASPSRVHEIAVRYDGEDLPELAARAGCSPADLAARHAAIAGQIVSNLSLGRTFAHVAEAERKIAELTPEAITAAFRRHVDPARLVIIRAGDFKK